MKVDRRNPRHWLYLAASALWVAVAIVLRPFRRRGRERARVLLYGHKLSGNLLAIHRHLRADPDGPQVAFLTIDPAYHRELAARGEPSVLATSARCLVWLATADAIISDHGLHTLQPLLYLSDLKFFDVWHGIPFKGFDADDFRVQQHYDEIWAPSPLVARLSVERFGFRPGQVAVTGYARTDRLVRERDADRTPILRRLGLPPDAGRIVLFAPTWKQDADARSLFPFGSDADAFCGALSDLARRSGATVLLRTHLNSGAAAQVADRYPRLLGMPYASHPDTEEILLASDVLVCDWSSIAFDFLLLDRPAIFLDVAPPFRKGFSLGPEYRYGPVVDSLDGLLLRLERCLQAPEAYRAEFGARHADVRARIYDLLADGHATERCCARLAAHLARGGSFR